MKDIYEYSFNHLRDWFPYMPSYERYVERINNLNDIVNLLLWLCFSKNEILQTSEKVAVDSMPIVVAKQSRSGRAKVASDIANKGYCATKKEYYYGVKLHLVVDATDNYAPYFCLDAEISKASEHDINFLKRNLAKIRAEEIFADKAYISAELCEMAKSLGKTIHTPIKKPKGKDLNFYQHLFSSLVSSTRQTVESAFSWLNEKVGISNASKVRSSRGLKRHVFCGLLASALNCC